MRDTGDAYTVMVWDLATTGRARSSVGPALDFRFMPGTDNLVAAEPDEPTLTVYDLEPDGDRPEDRQIPRPDVPFDGDGRRPLRARSVAVASLAGRRVDVLDLTTGASRATLEHAEPRTAGVQP